jgi:SAM-dependent methyltransferase
MARDSNEEWEKFGRSDPYYGVLTDDSYRAGRMTPESLAAFFETGRRHVEFVLQTIRRAFDPSFAPRSILDFGCGTGRLVVPFASHCQRVVGVDVSDSMLAEARRNCETRGLAHVEFVKSDASLSQVKGQFDLVHSYIVLMHIPPSKGYDLIGRLVDCIADGGYGALHVTFYDTGSFGRKVVNFAQKYVPFAHTLVNLMKGRPRDYPLMEMNQYDMNQLLRLLHDRHCKPVHIEFDLHDAARHLGAMCLFSKGRTQPKLGD